MKLNFGKDYQVWIITSYDSQTLDIGWLREIDEVYLEKSKSTFAFRTVTLFKN
jgi:hypothetical protein